MANGSQPSRIAAGTGRAFEVPEGHLIEIIAPEGPQVADTWAFALPGLDEFMSTEHTRSCLDRLTPSVGEAFYSNRRRPILAVVGDTSPGCHDLLLSACDVGRYTLLGHQGHHANCAENFSAALGEMGLTAPELPSPVNVFENVTIDADGTLHIVPPRVRPGESLTLRAEFDLVVVVSACPMDIVLTNGLDRRPKPIDISVMPANESLGSPANHTTQ